MHLSRLQKTLRREGAFRHERDCLLHVLPPGFPKFVPKPGFSEFPVRFSLCYLSLASRRKTKEALSFVCSRFDADPASLLHAVQGPSQCCTLHYKAFAQPFLIHFAGCRQRREQPELRDLKAGLLQLLVINSRYDPCCSTNALASAGKVKERMCGGRSRCFRTHNLCIYIY